MAIWSAVCIGLGLVLGYVSGYENEQQGHIRAVEKYMSYRLQEADLREQIEVLQSENAMLLERLKRQKP